MPPTKSTEIVPISAAPKDFYIRKGYLQNIIAAIIKMGARKDTSGKFAKHLAQIRRACAAGMEVALEEQDAIGKEHRALFPAGHPKAGDATPVYVNAPDGSPLFEYDEKGALTDERKVKPGEFNIADPEAYQRAMRDHSREVVKITCPALRDVDFAAFKEIESSILDPLYEVHEDNPVSTVPPKEGYWQLVFTVGEPPKAEDDDEGIDEPTGDEEERSAP